MLDIQRETDAPPHATQREDYRPPAHLIDTVDLHFALDAAATIVTSRLAVRRNPEAGTPDAPLHLDGEALELLGVTLDGDALDAQRYTVAGDALTIHDLPEQFMLEIRTRIAPEKNSELSGLYVSGGNFFTQCEAEGFRRITFFPDRPDVMARFTTTIEAERASCPVLLSNGNPEESGESPDGRHWARWVDPHPKPAYLFAVVAGDLVAVRDSFTTRSGRHVDLGIYVRDGDQDRCDHAMRCLKQSMTWDEDVFGLEYDLDVFNIAAVSDFNMGAMENKGLNVFNTKYVLARPDTATDGDYQGIETVISHEYFHNWTGNRVTCRDWFQLSLKEGLTVFRDQEFSADQGSRAVKRIADVRRLRAAQFPEDAGPLAHSVRPDSYIKIDNFYTATIYQKGAEVVRMMHTLLGPAAFRRGMDLYFARHDNHAVALEDFAAAMQDASGVDLTQFRLWYSQAGTPEITAEDAYDPTVRRYTLTLRQHIPDTPGQIGKLPMLVPVAMGLLDAEGAELPTRLAGEAAATEGTRVLKLTQAEQAFVFEDVPAPPVPSLLRGFSAPVRLLGVPQDRLRFLAAHDTDAFVRLDSGMQYATVVLLDLAARWQDGATPTLDAGLVEIMAATLDAAHDDPAWAAEALALPSESYLADQMGVVDPDAIYAVRDFARAEIGRHLRDRLRAVYDRLDADREYRIDGAAMGGRALKNMALAYLARTGPDGVALADAQFRAGRNMTDVLAALSILGDTDGPERMAALAAFYAQWHADPLVLDKWFSIQAMSRRPAVLTDVRALYRHKDFDLKNPNRFRSLVGAFADGNPVRFHDRSGEGYRFLADAIIELDGMNSQTAARLMTPLGNWRRQDGPRQAMMRAELQRILQTPRLSAGTYEKVAKSLG